MFNGGEEGKVQLEGGDMIKKKLLLNSIRVYKNRDPIYDQNVGKMAKIDTLFMTKTAEKPYPLGPHMHTYIAHIREYPTPPGLIVNYKTIPLLSSLNKVRHEPIIWSRHLLYKPLESTLSRVDL